MPSMDFPPKPEIIPPTFPSKILMKIIILKATLFCFMLTTNTIAAQETKTIIFRSGWIPILDRKLYGIRTDDRRI